MLNPDVLDLTGCHFFPLGRGPRHFDCVGFVLHAYNLSGINLSDPASIDESTITTCFGGHFVEVAISEMRSGDLVEMDSPGILGKHLGVAVGAKIIIHCMVKRGVVLSNIAMLESDITRVFRPKVWG